jgi:hypothetical protein
MSKRKIIGLTIIIISIFARASAPLLTAGSPAENNSPSFVGSTPELERQLEAALPKATGIIDTAISVLDKGWGELTPEEQDLFEKFFDPGKTGEVDEAFIEEVLGNYEKIRSDLEDEITIVYQSEAGKCTGMRLFYTDFIKIHVCPYIYEEQNPERIARDLIHEMAHISLLVVDRAYFSETDTRYLSLTPHGHWTAELPVIGKLFREIAKADTLYHPDAYSHYAAVAADS